MQSEEPPGRPPAAVASTDPAGGKRDGYPLAAGEQHTIAGKPIYSGKWTMFRFHIEDPVQFEKSIRVTIESDHANAHGNDRASTAYWYQREPHKPFSQLPPAKKRLPISERDSLRSFWKTL